MSGKAGSESPKAVSANTKPKLDDRKSLPIVSGGKPQQSDRNFRSHYYEKVGFRGVDERKTLELILKDDPISHEKCYNFAIRCAIPNADRIFVWKLLLGEEPKYQNNHENFLARKNRLYNDCKYLLTVAGRIDESWEVPQLLTVLWLLYDNRLNLTFKSQMNEFHSQNFMAIAESMLRITSNNEMESFWLAKGLANVINKHSEEVFNEMVQLYHRILSTNKSTVELYRHMEKIGFNEEIPLHSWFGRGFAGILKDSALQRIWDKLCCGAIKLLTFVAIALVDRKQDSLLLCQTPNEAIRCLMKGSDESDDIIAQKSIELWISDGSFLIPHHETAPVIARMSNHGGLMGLPSPKFPLVARIEIPIEADESVIIEEDVLS